MIEEIATRYGAMFVPDADEGQYYWLKNTGASPEDEHIELVCALLDERPSGMALDVGANFGCWTLPLAKHATVVHAFEPQPRVCDLLLRTVTANRPLPVYVHNVAVGAERGFIQVPNVSLEGTTNFGGVGVGLPHPEQPDAPMVEVAVVTVDGLVPVLAGETVSFIKADVEGFEVNVLRGAEKTIRRDRPILFVECDHPRTSTQELWDLMESLGYAIKQEGNNFLGMPL